MEENKTVTENAATEEETVVTEEELTPSETIKDLLNYLDLDPMDTSEKITACVIGGAAMTGASALATAFIKSQDLSGLKGFGKVFAGLGTVALAGAAGVAAKNYMKDKVHGTFKVFREIKDMLTPDYSK